MTAVTLGVAAGCAPAVQHRVSIGREAEGEAVEREPSLPGAVIVERLSVGAVAVDLERQADGRFRACAVAAPGIALSEEPLCVGPHDGGVGAGRSWGQAVRYGSDVLVLVIHARADAIADVIADSIADARLVTVPATDASVAVTAGVLADHAAEAVCLVYRSGGTERHITVDVTTWDATSTGESDEAPTGGPRCTG